ncbi:elongation factor P maturation arginine rhamnosyltransferase EarP [Shewanella sp. GXUN23E]|uniref:elongation factor P maturation arginine rhamnosyltransferase EarP n=1 Tax=Shewanella sp. GXUN23E TaxID=3422498 RepID=UPI003D7EC2C0
MQQQSSPAHWDIFCVVVDNYGDIGVTWRLAKQLAHEYQLTINLWVDDLRSFGHILPQLTPELAEQTHEGVRILKWNDPLDIDYIPGSVLIEAFACELPAQVKQALTAAARPPVWLNLEYLSAEDWVEGCHGLPSFQPGGINKYFYLPGFTEKTGGLICEQDLLATRDAWQANPQNRARLFADLGLTGIEPDHRIISAFSYETTALSALCELWSKAAQPMHLLLPKGRSLNSLTQWLPESPDKLTPGSHIQLGALTLHILPMTDQQGYDRLLWSCDFNIVRGEDSFVRAQWAARPFIWHIYQQEDDYHLVKLEAFMRLYCDNLAPEVALCWQQLNLAFNCQQQIDVQRLWLQIDTMRSELEAHAKHWPVDALKTADLATRLVQFVKK